MVAYFAFQQQPDQEFVFQLTDEDKIAAARRIISGEEKNMVHVIGRIRPGNKQYNPRWNYYLEPDSISFFEMAIEVCDANMQYVDDHLDETGGAFLPGRFWCPWDSKVSREVQPS